MCKTSYEELSLRYPDMAEQVEATLYLMGEILPGIFDLGTYDADMLRQHLSNLVLTCVSFVEEKGKGKGQARGRSTRR